MQMPSYQHLGGRSPGSSPCGYDIPGLAAAFVSLRRTTRSEAPKRLGERKAAPARGLCCTRCRPSQQRFRSRECHSGTPGRHRVFCNYESRQEGAVEVALQLPGSIAEAVHVHALGERLLGVGAGRQVDLAEARLVRAELNELPADRFGLPPDGRDEEPRAADLAAA